MPDPGMSPSGRRTPRNLAPVVSATMCAAVLSMNVFLMASIVALENPRRGPGPGAMPGQSSRPARLRAEKDPREKSPEGTNPSSARLLPTSPSWTSPHLVDCRGAAARDATAGGGPDEDGGMYMPVRCPSRECRRTHFLMNIHSPVKDDVSRAIYKEGCFECDHLTRLLEVLARRPDAYLLDVGGNLGMWTLAAAAAGHRAIALEPFEANYRRLCRSVDRNAFHDRVSVLGVAATSGEATFRIDVPNRNKGGGRLEAVTLDAAGPGDEPTVTGIAIDSLHLPTDRLVVLKLDVEGHEIEALAGALEFLSGAEIIYAMTE
ncbi:hypothetical protein ACHAWF_005180 [Thalassiosira exigua]